MTNSYTAPKNIHGIKKIFLFAIIAVTGMVYTAYNDEWEDELYTQMVSFKAPRGSDSVYNIYTRYKANGTGQYKLPVIVSGSTSNANDIDVRISVDNDTLNIPNKARLAVGHNDLWFKQLPERFYSFPSPTCHIPSGKVTANYIIDFGLSRLDPNEQWVLPLTIEPNSSYTQNMCRGWCKVLSSINLFNDCSGKYSATNMNIYVDGTASDPAVEDNRLTRIVDDHSIFFYAGTVWGEDVNRRKYKVIAASGEGTPDAESNITGPATITAGNPANEMATEQSGNCTYSYRVSKHPAKPYLERHIATSYLGYKYSDITSDPSNPIHFHCKGDMTMRRQYNILIPDEEQAILW